MEDLSNATRNGDEGKTRQEILAEIAAVRRQNAELRAAEANLRVGNKVLEGFLGGVAIADLSGTMTYADAAFLSSLGRAEMRIDLA